ncbi:MAG: hypothetical protein ACD_63C00023G0009 [uncultured bacterium]|nr:MAG: hypothetical protein ACD_63C00023G0009 [uncultured bacterium]
MLKLAINGFGRIGRSVFKAALERSHEVDVVAVNDLTDAKTLANLLQYDSVYGKYKKKVSAENDLIVVDGKKIKIFKEKDPANLPWKDLAVDVVVESTGFFVSGDDAKKHVDAGAKKVVISAPSEKKVVPTYLMGVNHEEYKGEAVIDMASCTTNCISPIAEIMHRRFGVEKAMMSTAHSYTSTQNLVDGPNDDLRRARAAAVNLVPTTTGAAIATTKAVPALKGLFDGIAFRTPTICGCMADFVFVLKKDVTIEEVNNVFKEEKESERYKGVLDATEEPLVSTDIIGRRQSSIVDLGLTNVVAGNLVKIVGWYDNEWAYSLRVIDLAVYINAK